MAVDLDKRKRVSGNLKSWLDSLAAYEKVFKPWETRARKVLDRYRDDKRDDREYNAHTRFNILWSNTQTLKAATFARLPKPDVSRRFRDNDQVGRVASLILERALEYEIGHYADYRATMGACVQDRFLPGRAIAWVRYDPKFKAAPVQVTEDEDQPELLDYECAPTDYIHWNDFGHSVARTWEEVTRVWRRVYMTKEALEERFDKEKVKLIPMDASPQKDAGAEKIDEDVDRAAIYEGWDKNTKKAVWFSKGVKDLLDERDDPLHLEEFFPCPRPMFATLTSDSLIPIPDYCQYQDQAACLDVLADRIDGLVKALQVKGVYDASQPALARLFTEGDNGELKPVKNWAAFAEKQGLKGTIDIVDIAPMAAALLASYQAFEHVKNQIYEITRISDIMRGFVDPDEKLGQSQLKTQYGNLGIKAYQDQVAQFATELLQLKAQVMCNKFDPQTLIQLAAADQLSEQDKRLVPQAMRLLMGERVVNPEAQGPNPLRSFRIEVASDSLIHLDDELEKQSRVEFMQGQAAFMKEFITPVLSAPPPVVQALLPVTMELWKFSTSAFKAGKNLEGSFDEAAEKLKQLAAQPSPQGVPPEVQKQLQQAQQDLQKKAQELAGKEKDLFERETKHQVDVIKHDAERAVFDMQRELAEEKLDLAADRKTLDVERKTDQQKQASDKAREEGRKAEESKAKPAVIEKRNEEMAATMTQVTKAISDIEREVDELKEIAAAEKEVVRDPKTGKVAGIRVKRKKETA